MKWDTSKSMPNKNFYSTAQIYNDKIYCIGGYDSGVINKVEIYDISNEIWSVGSPMPTARYQLTSQIYNGKIYCIGGTYNGYSGRLMIIQIYDIESDTWNNYLPNMPTDRYTLTSNIYENKIYCIGGQGYHSNLNTVEVYDTDTNTWSVSKPMPTGRKELNSSIHNKNIYCIGGIGYSGYNETVLNIVEVYDIDTNTWSVSKPMSTGKNSFTCQLNNDKIYCIGGNNNTVEVYDIKNNIWISYDKFMSTQRKDFCSIIYKNKIYCIGGKDGTNILNTIDIIILPYFSYDIILPSSIQNKLDCILDTGLGDKILSNKGEYIDIPKGYRFMESNEVTNFINEINID